jgi:hypothetical protein
MPLTRLPFKKRSCADFSPCHSGLEVPSLRGGEKGCTLAGRTLWRRPFQSEESSAKNLIVAAYASQNR